MGNETGREQTGFRPDDINVDPYPGYDGGNGKVIAPLDQVVNQIWYGFTIDTPNNTITYTFADGPTLAGRYNAPKQGYNNNGKGPDRDGDGEPDGNYNSAYFPGQSAEEGYTPFTDAQREAARDAIQLWDDLIPQDFVESNGMGADIVFANSSDPAQAYAYPPYFEGKGNKWQSDVFIRNPDENTSNGELDFGQYGKTALIHEIGHSIGLSHPGAYNGAGATNYQGQAEYFQDSTQYSIMSYWGAQNTGAVIIDWEGTGGFFYSSSPDGPLLHDVLAIQAAYGADPDTRSGDTTYGFNSTADRDAFDFNLNSTPHIALYDAGGHDTIDLSGFDVSQYLNMNAGTFSSIGQVTTPLAEMGIEFAGWYQYFYGTNLLNFYDPAELADIVLSGAMADNGDIIEYYTGVAGINVPNYDNFAIAYGVEIEDAVGGQGRDLIIGNDLDNMIDGQEGDDVIDAGLGDDIIIGGLGIDEMAGGEGADTFVLDNLDIGDIIMDFDGADGDMLDLSGIADMLGTDLSFIEADTFGGNVGEVRYDGGQLQIDANGDGGADYLVVMANNADVDASMMALAMSA